MHLIGLNLDTWFLIPNLATNHTYRPLEFLEELVVPHAAAHVEMDARLVWMQSAYRAPRAHLLVGWQVI